MGNICNFAMMGTDLSISPLQDWFPNDFPRLIIAGPCSAESEEQVMRTAREVAAIPQVKVFRAGLWKPRTRPGDFEGIGEKGMRWMQQVRREMGLKITVEVAEPRHVELALKYDVDLLWVGARTVVNPFSVQAIAEALKGTDCAVMVKNPVSPDLKLWLGAIERIYAAGIRKMIAIHRGFHYYERSPFRNAPMWEIPFELKRLLPDLPVIVDPSHISGHAEMIQSISQKAMDFEMDGLMIETHYDPHVAKTDASQQITPYELKRIVEGLILREKSGDIDFQVKLEGLRTEIDKIDGQLLQILASRMKVVDDIGKYKKEHDITILQMKRWAGIIEDRLAIGTHLGLEEQFLRRLLSLIHKESIQRQATIFTKNQKKNKKK
jgi:chorismate mutase